MILGHEARAQIDVRVGSTSVRIRRHLVAAHRHQAHRLGAAGDRPRAPDPHMMRSGAKAIACRPEEQNRLMVTADASTGIRRARLAMRATFRPCSASGIAQPRITSSTVGRVDAGRAAAPRESHGAAISSGRVPSGGPIRRLADGGPNGGNDYSVFHGVTQEVFHRIGDLPNLAVEQMIRRVDDDELLRLAGHSRRTRAPASAESARRVRRG